MNDSLVDIDFRTHAEQTGNLLGCVPRDFAHEPLGSKRRVFGAVQDVIPEDQWDDLCDQKDAEGTWASELVTRVFNQGQEGACVSDTFSQMNEVTQASQFGKENVVHLSAISLYKRVGSSPQSGSMLSDNLDEMQRRGVLPLDTPENRQRFGTAVMPNTGFFSKWPANWEETAKQFASQESFDCGDYLQVGTALLKGYPVAYARDGHCILAIKFVGRGKNRKLAYLNSWGEWGDPTNEECKFGIGYDSMRKFKAAAEGSIVVRTLVVPEWRYK